MAQIMMVNIYQYMVVSFLVLLCLALEASKTKSQSKHNDVLTTLHKPKDFDSEQNTIRSILPSFIRSIPPSSTNFKGKNLSPKPMLKSVFNINRFFRSNNEISKKHLLKSSILKCTTDECEKNKKVEGGKSLIEDDMPNTVLPNPNIYGGFPENDIWGNFELPPPSIIHKLKQQLKAAPFYHKQDYGVNQESTDPGYSYENRAFPEYDFKETPSFLQLMQHNSKSNAPGSAPTFSGSLLTTSDCNPTDSSCRHIKLKNCEYFLKLCDITSKHTKQGEIEKEGPCASKILEMFGCRSKIKKGNKLQQATLSHLNSVPMEKLKDPTKLLENKKINDSAIYLSETSADSTLNSVLNIENEINKFMKELKKEKSNDVKESTNVLQQEVAKNTSKNLYNGDVLKKKESKENETNFLNTTDTENSLVNNTDKNDGMFPEDDSGARMFSDWSSWSKCSCLRGSVMRRRNCLLMQCTGATEERKPCNKTQCPRNATFHLNELNTLETMLNNSSNSVIKGLKNNSSNNSSSDKINYNLTDYQILNNMSSLLSAQASMVNESSAPIAIPKPINVNVKSVDKEMENIINVTSESAEISTSDSARTRSSKKVEEDFIVNSLISHLASDIAQSQDSYITLPTDISLEFLPAGSNITKSQKNFVSTFKNSSGTHSLKNSDDDVVVDKLISRFESKLTQENNVNSPKNIASKSFQFNNSKILTESQHSQAKTNLNSLKKPEQDESASFIQNSVHNSTESADDIASAIVSLLSKKIAENQFDFLSKNNKLLEAKKRLSYNIKSCDCSNQLSKPCVGPIKHICLEPSKACQNSSCQVHLKITESGNECLSLLNGYRKRHGAIGLKWSHDLYIKALDIGRRIAFQKIPSKNLVYLEKPGVNIGYVFHNKSFFKTPCAKTLENWYSQKDNFHYENPKITMNNQEFIQMIWKSSERVGIAQAESVDKTITYVVAVFDPARNKNSDTQANLKHPSIMPVADIVIDLNTTMKKSTLARTNN